MLLLRFAAFALLFFVGVQTVSAAKPTVIPCEGSYRLHLQGVCKDEADRYFWCFTDELVQTDAAGRVLRKIDVPRHHGDLCYYRGRVYVAVNLGPFNRPAGHADSWIYVYEADDLAFVAKHAVPEVVHGAGGMATRGDRFFVVGGLPNDIDENYVYEYDADFRFIKRHVLGGGNTFKGIQTIALADGRWFFGCYGVKKSVLLTADADFGNVRRYDLHASYGIVPRGDGKLWIAQNKRTKDARHTAKLVPADIDEQRGFQLESDQ